MVYFQDYLAWLLGEGETHGHDCGFLLINLDTLNAV